MRGFGEPISSLRLVIRSNKTRRGLVDRVDEKIDPGFLFPSLSIIKCLYGNFLSDPDIFYKTNWLFSFAILYTL